MSHTTYLIVRPFAGKVTLARLSLLLRVFSVVRRCFMCAGVAAAVVVVVQLVYPASMVRPFLASDSVGSAGFKSSAAVQQKFTALNARALTIRAGASAYHESPDQVGVSINSNAAAKSIRSYSWRERLIPLSLFVRKQSPTLPMTIDNAKLQQFTSTVVSQNKVAAVSAGVTRATDGTYTMTKAVYGKNYSATDVSQAIRAALASGSTGLSLNGTTTLPKIDNEQVQQALARLDSWKQDPLKIAYNGASYTADGNLITAWSQIAPDASGEKITVSYDSAAIRTWLEATMPLIASAPQTSVVTMVNGQVANRSAAADGLGLDVDKTVSDIVTSLEANKVQLTASLQTLSPQEKFIRQYTPTSAGLQSLINDWANDYPGMTAGVSFAELGGAGRQATLNAGESLPTASVYKIFVAWYVLYGIEQGTINQNEQVVNGKNVEQCISAMIVLSDNPCGETLGSRYGWTAVDAFAAKDGFSSTALNVSPPTTTAAETTALLTQLRNGQILNAADTQMLLGYMGQQVYRDAIPAGSVGATVQDKVGFLGNTWDDIAIVSSSKNSYVLSVLTQNAGSGAIKDLAQRIQALMNT